MRFNVVVFDSKNKTYLSEFKHDKIIKLDKKRIDKLIGCDSSQIDNELLDFLLKIALIKKYKNLVYIDSKFVSSCLLFGRKLSKIDENDTLFKYSFVPVPNSWETFHFKTFP